jgi:hypothetical protein
MMYDAKATPRVVNCPLTVYCISSRGLWFIRSLVVLQDEGWAILYLLTNKAHKLNLEPRNRRNSSIYIPSSRLHLHSLFLPYYTHRRDPDLDITCLAHNNASRSKTHLITFTICSLPLGLRLVQLYYNANVLDVDSFSTHSDGTKG